MDYNNKYNKYKKKYYLLKQIAGYDNPELITFTAKWCGHCIRFQPVLDQLKNEKLNIKLINYDSEKDKNMMSKYNIQGFPTIMLNHKNKLIEYNGNRDKESIINFINSYVKKI
jgi:protein disulfide-isomerase A6